VEANRRPEQFSQRLDRERRSAWKLSTGDDLESALRAAERLLQQAEDRRRHEQNRTFALLSGIAGTTLSLFGSLVVVVEFASFGSSEARALTALLSFLSAAVVISLMVRSLAIQRRRIAFDFTLTLAAQISAMVAEALVDVADREVWSYLRLQATKLRLSAFPLIGPSGRPGKW
jgi:hypothetical protein